MLIWILMVYADAESETRAQVDRTQRGPVLPAKQSWVLWMINLLSRMFSHLIFIGTR